MANLFDPSLGVLPRGKGSHWHAIVEHQISSSAQFTEHNVHRAAACKRN
jgi:hypothetical protein